MRLSPETWATLQHGLDALIAHTDPKLLPSGFHVTLYTAVFNYVTATRSPLAREDDIDVPGLAELQLAPNQCSPAGRIYCTLSNKLRAHLTNILNAASEFYGEMLLEYYSAQWGNYLVMARMLDHDCAYLTRLWVKSFVAKRHDIYTVEALTAIQWKTILVDGLQVPDQRLSKALLDIISSHRAGKTSNLDLLESVLASLATLARSGDHGETTTPDVYHDIFEDVFLHESTEYYRREAAGLALGGVQSYIPVAGRWLDVEEGFANVLPTKESYAKLQTVLRDIFVIAHSPLIESYMVDSISQTYHGGLKELYSFCLRLGALDHLRETFMRLFGRAALSALSGEKDDALTDSDAQLQLVSEIKGVYSDIVVEDFEKDDVILEALDRDTTATIHGPRVGRYQRRNSGGDVVMKV